MQGASDQSVFGAHDAKALWIRKGVDVPNTRIIGKMNIITKTKSFLFP